MPFRIRSDDVLEMFDQSPKRRRERTSARHNQSPHSSSAVSWMMFLPRLTFGNVGGHSDHPDDFADMRAPQPFASDVLRAMPDAAAAMFFQRM
jgi:hypothetical protein